MSSIEDVKKMQLEGKSDQEITAVLRQKGFPEKSIPDIISQAKIKQAVGSPVNGEQRTNSPSSIPMPPEYPQEQNYNSSPKMTTDEGTIPQESGEYTGMEPSMITQDQEQYQDPTQQDYQESYPVDKNYATEAYAADAYDQYQPYQESISSDIITEISEQVVNDKLLHIQDSLEKAIDFKNAAEAKITSLNERLKRIEKIIDRLQLSLLQKMGDYVADIGDIKHEMIENQESFKALLPKLREIHGERRTKKKSHHPHAKRKHTKKKVP